MTAPGLWWPSTIRARLTLLYAAAFFVASATILALIYIYLSQTFNHQLAVTDVAAQAQRHLSPDSHDAVMAQLQQAREDTLNRMLIASIVLLGVVGVVATGLGWLLAGQVLHPLQRITATARRVADRSLHERIGLVGPNDEIKDLAETFDAMLERLDRSFDGQRRFVANASHELRTPLTINRTLIEVALNDPQASESMRQLGGTLLDVNQRHERLIDGLLTLASSEQCLTNPVPVDLADIARRVATESQGAAQHANLHIRTDLQPGRVAGDPVLLGRLTHNLVDNAIAYNLSDHGWVAVTTGTMDCNVYLTVENSGPLVPPYEVPSLFEPFRRLATTERLAASSSTPIVRGAGLGLSIVRSVARAHGGDVNAVPREDGGLTVRVRIPAVAEA